MGGGYPKQGMSLVALDWMLAHAADSGLGAFYRWAPRDIRKYCARNGIPPRIHLTVAERIANATDDNAPGNIPPAVTVATTPVDRDDPRHTERERILGRRAEAVQAVLQQALADTYLLDKARTHVTLGDGSYWLMVIAWLMVALGGLQLAASAARPDPGTFTVAGALIAVGLVCLLCCAFPGRLRRPRHDRDLLGILAAAPAAPAAHVEDGARAGARVQRARRHVVHAPRLTGRGCLEGVAGVGRDSRPSGETADRRGEGAAGGPLRFRSGILYS